MRPSPAELVRKKQNCSGRNQQFCEQNGPLQTQQIFSNAPEKDQDGDSLVVRFNRKDGSHILSSEAKGKKKKLFYVFDGGAWKEMQRD